MCPSEPVHFEPASFGDLINDFLSTCQENPRSGSDEKNQERVSMQFTMTTQYESRYYNEYNERKIRRMLSNRLSARRSRLRKKTHLENTTTELNRSKALNRELKNRLSLVTYQLYIVRRENEQLCCETVLLNQRLYDLYHSLVGIN
ncbi:hypothetical protein BVRB_1g014730 [Beta vulgaris subsp. vulgaris]|nr:hypothetical protein BVRB_1g014730 [Beta vulgaris subsp. vulgaris]